MKRSPVPSAGEETGDYGELGCFSGQRLREISKQSVRFVDTLGSILGMPVLRL